MMTTEWVTVEDVRRRWHGAEDDFSDELAEVLVEDAVDIITRALPELPKHIKDGTVTAQTVKRVVARMVTRVLRNPEGIRTATDSDGPLSLSTTFAGDHPGELVMTDDDRKELTPGGEGSSRKAFSVMPNYSRR